MVPDSFEGERMRAAELSSQQVDAAASMEQLVKFGWCGGGTVPMVIVRKKKKKRRRRG